MQELTQGLNQRQIQGLLGDALRVEFKDEAEDEGRTEFKDEELMDGFEDSFR